MTIDPTHISALPIFAGLRPPELAKLLSEAQLHRVPKNSPLFEEGAEAHSFFVLVEGHLRVVRLTIEGEQVLMRYIAPGEICGIATAIGRTTYPATAIAAVDSTLLAWPSTAWARLSKAYPTLGSQTLRVVGSRLQDTQNRVIEMSTQEVERRVAHALLRLVRQAGRKVEQGIEIAFPISRQDVAEMTGTTLHTVSRILSAWEGEGLVSGGRQRIVIRDAHRLLLLAEAAD